jgi:hypothetical protein
MNEYWIDSVAIRELLHRSKIFSVPLARCMTSNIEDISPQVHQMLLAMSPEVSIPYPSLAYHAGRIFRRKKSQKISIVFDCSQLAHRNRRQ